MSLTEEQITFIEECNTEFSDRYTDADLDYKKVYDQGIPCPPIMCPWYTRSRFANRGRAGGSRYQDYGNRNSNRNWDGPSYNQNRNFNRFERRERPY